MPEQTKKCPFCAEEILFEAIKCKHCGEMLIRKESYQPSSGISGTQILGGVILVIGLMVGLYFWQFFDPSVEIPQQEVLGQVIGGGRVNNLGLLQEKQTGTFLGFGAAAIGIILALVGKRNDPILQTGQQGKSCVQPLITQDPSKTTILCPGCGESEAVPSVRLCDTTQYKNFSVKVKSRFGFQTLILTCRNCGKQFNYDDIPIGSKTDF